MLSSLDSAVSDLQELRGLLGRLQRRLQARTSSSGVLQWQVKPQAVVPVGGQECALSARAALWCWSAQYGRCKQGSVEQVRRAKACLAYLPSPQTD